MMKPSLLLAAAAIMSMAASLAASPSGVDAGTRVDQLLAKYHTAESVKAYPVVDDVTFLRRAYLDIAGRIPTYAEAHSFYTTTGAGKRGKLVDELLDSEAAHSHLFNWWADLLRAKTLLPNHVPGAPEYIAWIKEQIRDNTPYDVMVRELVTASGYPRDNPAVGYYLRDNGMPLDNMSNTAQVFLGTRLQCAQCHDHPFDEWTQKDFYGMAAHTFGVKTRQRPQEMSELDPVIQPLLGLMTHPAQFLALQELSQPFAYGALENTTALRLPGDYPYDNAVPNQVIEPNVLFGPAADYRSGDERASFAQWMTSPDNPRFTKVIANRLWKKVMGHGLFEPVDDLSNKTRIVQPELLDFLAGEMVRLDYDLKAFLAMLCKTELYQREKHTKDIESGTAYAFPGPVMHRMSAEQIWDSVMTLSARNLDTRKGPPTPQLYGDQEQRAKIVLSKKPAELLDLATKIAVAENNYREKFIEMRRMGRTPNLAQARQETISEILGTDEEPMMGMMQGRGRNDYRRMLVRASELPSPMPPGRFLRQFGQSDREVIENANADASIPQALKLMNGTFYQVVLNPDSPLLDLVKGQSNQMDVAEKIFISMMTRPPDRQDRELMRQQLKKFGNRMGMANIIWALFNTREFLFIP